MIYKICLTTSIWANRRMVDKNVIAVKAASRGINLGVAPKRNEIWQ